MTYDELRGTSLERAFAVSDAAIRCNRPPCFTRPTYRYFRKGPGLVHNRDAFMRLMATAMRHRLVDHARRRLAGKRGCGAIHEELEPFSMALAEADSDIEATLGRLDRALEQLTDTFPRAAHVVQLRFILGLSTEDTAQELGLSLER